jgi:hypothetical protein
MKLVILLCVLILSFSQFPNNYTEAFSFGENTYGELGLSATIPSKVPDGIMLLKFGQGH